MVALGMGDVLNCKVGETGKIPWERQQLATLSPV